MVQPKITISGKTLVFPVGMEPGAYIEYRGMEDCKLYGPNGQLITTMAPQGDAPTLDPGDNAVKFECDAVPGINNRACVTVISRGDPISE